MYHRNIKPKIFTDITTPAKQSHSPDTGKIFQERNKVQFLIIIKGGLLVG